MDAHLSRDALLDKRQGQNLDFFVFVFVPRGIIERLRKRLEKLNFQRVRIHMGEQNGHLVGPNRLTSIT